MRLSKVFEQMIKESYMFWSSITGGLKVLTFWEVYVAALIFTIISVGPMILFGIIGKKNEGLGCLGVAIIAPIFQALATIIFVFTLFPIILGLTDGAAWTFPWEMLLSNTWPMIKTALIVLIGIMILAFIPGIGTMASFQVLVSGTISLQMVLGILRAADPNFPFDKIQIMPGFFMIIGFLIIAGVVSWVSTMLVALISAAIGEREEDYAIFIAVPLGGVLGFIPVFMYGSYIGQQLITPSNIMDKIQIINISFPIFI